MLTGNSQGRKKEEKEQKGNEKEVGKKHKEGDRNKAESVSVCHA